MINKNNVDFLFLSIEGKHGNNKEYRDLKKFMKDNDINYSYDVEIKGFEVDKECINKISEYKCLNLFDITLFYIINQRLQDKVLSVDKLQQFAKDGERQ